MIQRFLIIIAVFIITLSPEPIAAQNSRTVKGYVLSEVNGKPLSFATVAVKNRYTGTVTNEDGYFEYIIEDYKDSDTLSFSYVGFYDSHLRLSDIQDPIYIELKTRSLKIEEVVVRPQTPTEMIRRAVRKIKVNYAYAPFSTLSYYQEKTIENGERIRKNEAVFKTYYENFQDAEHYPNQLMLHRLEGEEKKLSFTGEQEIKISTDTSESTVDQIEGAFGGPEQILKLTKLGQMDPFLDSTLFKKFRYNFSENQVDGLTTIHFKSKRKIDHVKYEGHLVIDNATDAIVSISTEGEVRVPFYARALLFVMKVKLKDVTINVNRRYRQIQDLWYPENNLLNLRLYLSLKGKKSDLFFEQIYHVNKINIESPQKIPQEKVFDPSRKFGEQIFNDEELIWSEINVVH